MAFCMKLATVLASSQPAISRMPSNLALVAVFDTARNAYPSPGRVGLG